MNQSWERVGVTLPEKKIKGKKFKNQFSVGSVPHSESLFSCTNSHAGTMEGVIKAWNGLPGQEKRMLHSENRCSSSVSTSAFSPALCSWNGGLWLLMSFTSISHCTGLLWCFLQWPLLLALHCVHRNDFRRRYSAVWAVSCSEGPAAWKPWLTQESRNLGVRILHRGFFWEAQKSNRFFFLSVGSIQSPEVPGVVVQLLFCFVVYLVGFSVSHVWRGKFQ